MTYHITVCYMTHYTVSSVLLWIKLIGTIRNKKPMLLVKNHSSPIDERTSRRRKPLIPQSKRYRHENSLSHRVYCHRWENQHKDAFISLNSSLGNERVFTSREDEKRPVISRVNTEHVYICTLAAWRKLTTILFM